MIGFFAFVMVMLAAVVVLVAGLTGFSRRDRLGEADPSRLDRIESALTSLESRLDEIQDQQRFLERLLAERPDDRQLGPGSDPPEPSEPSEPDSILFDTGAEAEAGDR